MIALDPADAIAFDDEHAWLARLSPLARAAYGELLLARGDDGTVPAEEARAAVRAALEPEFCRIDAEVIAAARGRDTTRATFAATEAVQRQCALAASVLGELDGSGLVIVGVAEGSPWRVWTKAEADEAREVFG